MHRNAIVAAIAIPTLLESKKAADEAYIESVCLEVASGEEQYYTEHGRYGTFEELSKSGSMSPEIMSGSGSGYQYLLEIRDNGQDWSLVAWPMNPRSHTKSYYIDTTGEIRHESYTSHSDEKAGPDSPPLMEWDDSDWGD